MILSEKHNFIFIKGRKVAGTSMEVLLSSICGDQDILTPITAIDEQSRLRTVGRGAQNYGASEAEHSAYIAAIKAADQSDLIHVKTPSGAYTNHMSYVQLQEEYGDFGADRFVFALERCPYRKIISLANMKLNFDSYQKSGRNMVSSEAMLKAKISDLIENGGIDAVKNIDLYKDKNGQVVVHFLRYENLASEVLNIMSHIGVEEYSPLPHLKKGMSGQALDVLTVFSAEQLRAINKVFEEEFEYYAYPLIAA